MTTSADNDLPDTIRRFLTAHAGRDVGPALRTLAPDVVIADQGERYLGTEGARRFLQRAGSEFTYTTELRGILAAGAGRWVVTNHLEGDFPGGVADLDYTFVLDGELIAELSIT